MPPITLWLIWRVRASIAVLTPRGSFLSVLLLAGAGSSWLLGELAAVNALSQFALTARLIFAATAALGWTVARRTAFPLVFLLFAVPFGDFTQPKLMEWTAHATVFGLRLTGVPVFSEGQNLVIPSGSWSVVEACSGVRYLIASVTVGTLFAYLTYSSLKRRVLFVGVSIIVPIVANWLRQRYPHLQRSKRRWHLRTLRPDQLDSRENISKLVHGHKSGSHPCGCGPDRQDVISW